MSNYNNEEEIQFNTRRVNSIYIIEIKPCEIAKYEMKLIGD